MTRLAALPRRAPPAAGSALVVVLWCLVIIAIVAVTTLHATRLELRVTKNFGDLSRARSLAIAGIEKAKAALWTELTEMRDGGVERFDLAVFDSPADFRDIPLGRGLYRVIRSGGPVGGSIVHGITDEESRLNVNHASADELAKLPGLSREIAAAIVDWRDADDTVTPGGAERDDYAGLVPPRTPRNRPFETLRELLMVRGVTPELLLGEDGNANGVLDPEEDDGAETLPVDDADGVLDPGFAAFLTLCSETENETAAGERRINLTTATEETLTEIDGITAEIARAIVFHRTRKELKGLADLFDVEGVREETKQAGQPQQQQQPPQGQPPADSAGPGRGRGRSPRGSGPRGGPPASDLGSGPAPAPPGQQPPGQAQPVVGRVETTLVPTGQKIIGQELLKQIADKVTFRRELSVPGCVNINTASEQVIATLPGVDIDLAVAIASHRRAQGGFANVAELLDVPGMTIDIFKGVAERVTARSSTFRIVAEGFVPSTGARALMATIVRAARYEIETLSWSESP